MSCERKICFFSGSRAEFWLLRPLMLAIRESPCCLQFIVSGAHLSPLHENSQEMVWKQDGFEVDVEIETLLSSDSRVGTCKAMGLGMISYGEALSRLSPDLLVLLGDRFETFAVAAAACVLSLPIAHIHGGEVTTGAYDDSLRHSITKMSHLHFVSTEEYRQRVIQLGEHPRTVFHVGAIGVADINSIPFIGRDQLEKELDFSFGDRSIIVTFHPVTRERGKAEKQIEALLAVLEQYEDLHIVFTGVNADAAGQVITRRIRDFVVRHQTRTVFVSSLGRLRYLSAVRLVNAVVGNSSSGIIEVPSLGIPVVNIGNRQHGRVQATSIINCEPDVQSIRRALDISFSGEQKILARNAENPYEQSGTVEKIVSILTGSGELSTTKQFFNMGETRRYHVS